MNIQDAYHKFINKVNENHTNDNIVVDKPRFVSLFNEYQNRYVEWVLEKRNEDEIRNIQVLVVSNKPLKRYISTFNNIQYILPKDYFDFIDITGFVKDKECGEIKFNLFEAKGENISVLFSDENSKPSLKYRESFYTFGGNKVILYKDNFDFNKVYLTYYKYPLEVDISGYIKMNNSQSVDTDPIFDDKVVDRILSAAAKGFDINTENYNKISLDNDRIFSKI